jgi:hypothetical protein
VCLVGLAIFGRCRSQTVINVRVACTTAEKTNPYEGMNADASVPCGINDIVTI